MEDSLIKTLRKWKKFGIPLVRPSHKKTACRPVGGIGQVFPFTVINNAFVGFAISSMGSKTCGVKGGWEAGRSRTFFLGQYQARGRVDCLVTPPNSP